MKFKYVIFIILCTVLIYGCSEDNSRSNSSLTNIENSGNNENTGNEETIPSQGNPQPNPPAVTEGVCNLIFDGNGGTGGQDGYYMYKSIDINNTTDLPVNTFTKDGYEFLGWSEDKYAYEPDYFDASMYKVEKNVTFYAVWAPKDDVYTINLITYNNTNFMPKKMAVRKGSYTILPPILSNKPGYITIGYSVQNSIIDAELHEGEKYTPEKNTDLYVIYSDGRCIKCAGKTLFVKGVKVNENDWETKFTYRGDPPANMPLRYKTAVWRADSNWYSVNQYNYKLCWAACANNMLLWWKYNNQKYIDKYLETNKYTGAKFNYYYDNWMYRGHSDIFEKEFVKYWANDGNYTTKALDWFLKGDNEHSAGGYFKDVFAGKEIAYIIGNVDKTKFNYYLTQIIQQNKIAGLHIENPGDHIVTFWGADYDEDGFIKAVYTTNSQVDGRTVNDNAGGLEVDYVSYPSNSKYPMLNGAVIPVIDIHVFTLGEDIWKEYFNKQGITFPEDDVNN